MQGSGSAFDSFALAARGAEVRGLSNRYTSKAKSGLSAEGPTGAQAEQSHHDPSACEQISQHPWP